MAAFAGSLSAVAEAAAPARQSSAPPPESRTRKPPESGQKLLSCKSPYSARAAETALTYESFYATGRLCRKQFSPSRRSSRRRNSPGSLAWVYFELVTQPTVALRAGFARQKRTRQVILTFLLNVVGKGSLPCSPAATKYSTISVSKPPART